MPLMETLHPAARPTGMPQLTAKRSQSRSVQLPRTVAHDGRNVVWDLHFLAGTCFGSGSGWGAGSGSDGVCGSSTGSSSGSTTIVRNGSPICIIAPLDLDSRHAESYCMIGRRLAREDALTDQTPAHMSGQNRKYLANPVDAGRCVLPCFLSSSHAKPNSVRTGLPARCLRSQPRPRYRNLHSPRSSGGTRSPGKSRASWRPASATFPSGGPG